ncbi:DUF1206 domain-containing protein [Caulobacter sp.]|uniref:DUF1206 domain-containing protein n=1 Tax=Caulobacter sp. TaxID=78 RepID=UPI0025C3FACF|nr:DUF1206 domain-containing protein [Caulobacter sp.]
MAAADVRPRARGAKALAAWADWPLGLVLVGLVAVSLLGFAGWRALQAAHDVATAGRLGVLSGTGAFGAGLERAS